jgi:hypothetical protein
MRLITPVGAVGPLNGSLQANCLLQGAAFSEIQRYCLFVHRLRISAVVHVLQAVIEASGPSPGIVDSAISCAAPSAQPGCC